MNYIMEHKLAALGVLNIIYALGAYPAYYATGKMWVILFGLLFFNIGVYFVYVDVTDKFNEGFENE